ncbi:MAG TPA: hypothetical protein VFA87_06955, partial [Rhizomicrobium sp.]|nr:hypothetical protein [Rhizomicrobium sp.]
ILGLALAAATFSLPALAQSETSPETRAAIVAATGIPADPNYNPYVGATLGTVQEAQNDTSNGRAVDLYGQRNTNLGMIMSQQRHELGETDPF